MEGGDVRVGTAALGRPGRAQLGNDYIGCPSFTQVILRARAFLRGPKDLRGHGLLGVRALGAVQVDPILSSPQTVRSTNCIVSALAGSNNRRYPMLPSRLLTYAGASWA